LHYSKKNKKRTFSMDKNIKNFDTQDTGVFFFNFVSTQPLPFLESGLRIKKMIFLLKVLFFHFFSIFAL